MDIVTNKEKIVRILHNDWVVDGKIQVNAFSMRQNETYVSVNRPAIQSFTDDVSEFVYRIGEGKHMPASAILQKVQLRLLQLSILETLEIVQRS